jgi:hypothetical protein
MKVGSCGKAGCQRTSPATEHMFGRANACFPAHTLERSYSAYGLEFAVLYFPRYINYVDL